MENNKEFQEFLNENFECKNGKYYDVNSILSNNPFLKGTLSSKEVIYDFFMKQQENG